MKDELGRVLAGQAKGERWEDPSLGLKMLPTLGGCWLQNRSRGFGSNQWAPPIELNNAQIPAAWKKGGVVIWWETLCSWLDAQVRDIRYTELADGSYLVQTRALFRTDKETISYTLLAIFKHLPTFQGEEQFTK